MPTIHTLRFLRLASEIVVTGDSISMLAEACATRKPVHIFDVGEGENAMRPKCGKAHRTDRNWLQRWTHAEAAHIRAFGYRQMMRFGPPRLSRDICLVHGHLTTPVGPCGWATRFRMIVGLPRSSVGAGPSAGCEDCSP